MDHFLSLVAEVSESATTAPRSEAEQFVSARSPPSPEHFVSARRSPPTAAAASETEQAFHSVMSSTERTLMDSPSAASPAAGRRAGRRPRIESESDRTLADSVVDSMLSCAETLVGDDDTTNTPHHTPVNADEYAFDDADNPYPTVEFLPAGVSGGPRWGGVAGAEPVVPATPPPSEDGDGPPQPPPPVAPARRRSRSASAQGGESLTRRLAVDTQELSRELLEHVDALQTTLNRMSSGLGISNAEAAADQADAEEAAMQKQA